MKRKHWIAIANQLATFGGASAGYVLAALLSFERPARIGFAVVTGLVFSFVSKRATGHAQ